MKYAKQDNLLEVLLALEDRIMRKLQVASFGIVTSVDTFTNRCNVRTFPVEDESRVSETICVYAKHLEADLVLGSVVIILYMDKDFRHNLELVLMGDELSRKESSVRLHSDSNAVIIQVFKKGDAI